MTDTRNDLLLISPVTTTPATGYSHVAGIPAGRRLVWTSGQVPIDANGQVAPVDDWEAQARLTFRNLGVVLEAAGATWSDVFKLTIYVVDLAALPAIRAARDEVVDVNRPPTSSLIQVAGLFRPDVLMEIEAVAAVG